MKSKIKIIILIIACMCLTGWYAIIDKPISIYDTSCDTSAFQSITLESWKEISQTFKCGETHMEGVALKIAADGAKDKSQVVLSYEILDNSTGKSIVKNETNLKKLSSGKFFKIKFPTVSDANDTDYTLKIVVKECPVGNVRVFYTPGITEQAQLTYDGQTIEGTGVMRTLTHRFDLETYIVTLCFVIYIILFMRWLYKLFE